MRVVGIDPGLTATGYGVVEQTGNRMTPLTWGVIRSNEETLAGRLGEIHLKLRDLITEQKPDLVAVEEIFLAKNPRSALLLGHARGVALLAAGLYGYPVREYPANSVKQAVAGRGGASKKQVEYMVFRLLGLSEQKMLPDASDALAVAICCIMKQGLQPANRGSVRKTNEALLKVLAMQVKK